MSEDFFKRSKQDEDFLEMHNKQFEDEETIDNISLVDAANKQKQLEKAFSKKTKDPLYTEDNIIYTWEDLQKKTPEELSIILNNLQDTLYIIRKKNQIKINTILYTQEQIKKQRGTFK